ncbi:MULTISPECIES: sugar ABC transporter permease [unclassified Chelatococcus]|jgi:multiple sugar transport system permease protein|uniref:carbohydrate ABC transporter permease n=1 Tax=unclassified Chelatococcus TaxID=2638111 RepID=UPI001BCE48AD|nr:MULTISPECIES: sugar ABC transporter permease [unclassified Chelatococcus]CAH1655881.1 Sugar ABC transporter permease [Hyphomicrobiales bacterium]MBS7742541.1 sugar ABC transporter permease [Chelatococcus sp. HY11]MBX3542341.1 sugar ABC transporter permease [Chelatococcus sp.]MCO5075441.1 sugar ABC transporter permease [Chelatococcus sp.]CAH1695667.1 Sugar ABC transporter permease [Hyphomicrobiales bacterium]
MHSTLANLRAKARDWLLPASFLAPALLVLIVINVIPLFYTITTSFQNYYLPKSFERGFNGLDNYAELVLDQRFWAAAGRTFIFVTASLIIELVLGFVIALMLFRQRWAVGALRGLILLPIIITPIAVAFVWRLLFSPSLGLLNYLLAFVGLGPFEWIYSPNQALISLIIVEVWQHTPELMLIIYTGLLTLPEELSDAARIDGANPWQVFKNIKLPLLKPILMVGIVFRVIALLKTFDVFYIVGRGGPGTSTETLALYVYASGFSFLRMGYASALAMVLFLIVLASTILIVRWGDVKIG